MATIDDLRRLALALPAAEESSQRGAPDFRVGGRIFATLAHADKGYGNLMLRPEIQADFLAEGPEVFLPVAGGWGRNGATHIVLALARQDTLRGALAAAHRIRSEKSGKPTRRMPQK